MPSEKSRYLNRKSEPAAPVELADLNDHLVTLGSERLANMIWCRSQYDDVLEKAATVAVALRLENRDYDQAKAAIDYALHFPDYVRYTEGGHGLILDEIKAALKFMLTQGQSDLALRLAWYTVERGQEVAENFEDDWEWTSSLEAFNV